MDCYFIGMYRLIRDFKRVEVSTEFFKDLEKVFDDIADVLSYCPLMEFMEETER